MSTITSRIRTGIAIAAAGAALVASSGVATARSTHHHTGADKPVASHTTAAARSTSHLGSGAPVVVSQPATAALDAGSAGIDGYDDAACQSLLHDYNTAVDNLEAGVLAGDDSRASTYGNLANRIMGQMSDNCLVVY